MKQEKHLTVKDKLEILEAICTILVTLMAVWGTIHAWESGLWHKVKHIIEYSHDKIVADELKAKQES